MKNIVKILIVFMVLLFVSCKNDNELKKVNISETVIEKPMFSDSKKTEIVKFYLINERKLSEKDFYKIIFLNDASDSVKVIHYEGRDAFFTFKFSKALLFYQSKNKE